MNPRIILVGGGIVGLATAYKLLQKTSAAQITVLEKDDSVGAQQTGHNSGVVHSGLYYKPGSDKALLCTSGRQQLLGFCTEHGIRSEVCGKLVVATREAELPRLQLLHERGVANGLSGLRFLTPPEAAEYEPHVRCVAALLVPETGIVDFAEVARELARAITQRGGRVVTSARVTKLAQRNTFWIATTAAGEFEADYLVTCAGLHADRVARVGGAETNVRIVPFRGDYFTIKATASHLVRNLVYPVPNPLFPFLGVHATRSIHGYVHVGPTAALAFAREGYRPGAFDARDALNALLFPGLWRFVARHPQMVSEGVQLAASKGAFLKAVQRLIPDFRAEHLERRESGVRAQAMLPNGQLVDDFMFADGPRATHVLNAPSPAATAAFAIGDVIAQRVVTALA